VAGHFLVNQKEMTIGEMNKNVFGSAGDAGYSLTDDVAAKSRLAKGVPEVFWPIGPKADYFPTPEFFIKTSRNSFHFW